MCSVSCVCMIMAGKPPESRVHLGLIIDDGLHQLTNGPVGILIQGFYYRGHILRDLSYHTWGLVSYQAFAEVST